MSILMMHILFYILGRIYSKYQADMVYIKPIGWYTSAVRECVRHSHNIFDCVASHIVLYRHIISFTNQSFHIIEDVQSPFSFFDC